MAEITCPTCGSVFTPSGYAARVRCDYCGADTVVDRVRVASGPASAPSASTPADRVRDVLDETDPQLLLEIVTRKLRSALGASVTVEASGLGGRGVRSVTAKVGEHRIELRVDAGRLSGRRSRVVNGVPVGGTMIDARTLPDALGDDLARLGVLDRFLKG